MKLIYTLLILSTIVGHASSWSSSSNVNSFTSIRSIGRNSPTDLNVLKSPKEDNAIESAEETTEKYGLEAGLFQSLKSNDGESAKSLLSKYGIAYLATSIPLAIVSFSICYVLVDNGVDVTGLLSKVGINAGDTGDKVGTFAIAYAAHKAASPIRFPPTVILTPVVAKLIGKEVEEVDE
eukprot:CAMPEP_0184858230 /NCGR_PEP_ID=MMETSP0580-20130426/3357_1 /TAXON_ID=1118495 /ORGANISM="Dactyliosolen fragilissimus" /LENGTH=178 /DNA_ID=CAMNT_0027354275 /DNA_START=123 /DNA_END=659 /DNA_ORIENTATION=+